jgi:phosphoglycolate phosphatase-like HAD superfamily hydrolase
MHLVVLDIDGTLTNTKLEDGECYWRALCELLGFSSEQPQWSEFRHVTDGKSFDFAVALATGGLRVSAELKLPSANLLNPFTPIASSNDAVSRREEIIRIAARRAAEKHATQFAKFTYVGDGVWDAKAARDLGWRFIGIGSGEQADRLRQAGAGMVIPDYRPAEGFLDLLAD